MARKRGGIKKGGEKRRDSKEVWEGRKVRERREALATHPQIFSNVGK